MHRPSPALPAGFDLPQPGRKRTASNFAVALHSIVHHRGGRSQRTGDISRSRVISSRSYPLADNSFRSRPVHQPRVLSFSIDVVGEVGADAGNIRVRGAPLAITRRYRHHHLVGDGDDDSVAESPGGTSPRSIAAVAMGDRGGNGQYL